MSQVITVRIRFDIDTTSAEQSLGKVVIQAEIAERMLLKTLSIVRQLSGDENLNRFIGAVQRAIAVVNQLQIVSNLLATTNPWLWALGIIGTVGTLITYADLGGSYI